MDYQKLASRFVLNSILHKQILARTFKIRKNKPKQIAIRQFDVVVWRFFC